jgi:hypothetical protein
VKVVTSKATAGARAPKKQCRLLRETTVDRGEVTPQERGGDARGLLEALTEHAQHLPVLLAGGPLELWAVIDGYRRYDKPLPSAVIERIGEIAERVLEIGRNPPEKDLAAAVGEALGFPRRKSPSPLATIRRFQKERSAFAQYQLARLSTPNNGEALLTAGEALSVTDKTVRRRISTLARNLGRTPSRLTTEFTCGRDYSWALTDNHSSSYFVFVATLFIDLLFFEKRYKLHTRL